MWQAIQYVGSGVTLAAFIVAVVAWVLKSKSEERAKLIDLAKEDERADLVRDALEFFRVDTAGLTKSQQYQLALEQIRERAQRFKILAAVVCVIAVLGAVVVVIAITRLSVPTSSKREPDNSKQVLETQKSDEAQALLDDARIKFRSGEFSAAWKDVEKSTALNPNKDAAREVEVDIAMEWIRQLRSAGQALYDLLEGKLVGCLEQRVTRAKGERAADIHAHIGWANFLRKVENVPVEAEFKKAIELDANNPYGNAMWGYWLIRNDKRTEGKARFEAAFKSGREKEFVRRMQLGAWQTREPECQFELIRVFDDMRKKNEIWPAEARERFYSIAYDSYEPAFLRGFQTILPGADHLATFLWLIDGWTEKENASRDFFLAELTEAAGDKTKALGLYRQLLGQPTNFEAEVKAAIKRITASTAQGTSDKQAVSETTALLESAKNADSRQRASLIRSMARADIDQAEVLPQIVAWARDSDAEVRSAACETLIALKAPAVPAVIPLLSSREPRDVMNAAAILGQIGLEPELAVPALAKSLKHPDDDVKEKVAKALGEFGEAAGAAVPSLIETLHVSSQKDLQQTIAYTLGETGAHAKDAVPLLINLLTSTNDSEGFLNVVAAEALGKIGSGASNAVPKLILALESDDVRLPTNAAEALGNIGAPAQSAILPLVSKVKVTDKEHRKNYGEPLKQIAEALAIAEETKAIPTLRKAIGSLESANMEQELIAPLQTALDSLKDRQDSQGKEK